MSYVAVSVFVMAAVTYLIRMLPLTLMRQKINSVFIRSVLAYVPYAVLTAMTLPFILYSTSSMISAAIGLAVAVILALMEQSLITVALGASAAVFIAELFV
ncbi:MAG: AzlD domain-containing protein [Oscillospiraceae bacterium]|nr:AzlD domain-containing protein [Oscillospiraceae bacterium]